MDRNLQKLTTNCRNVQKHTKDMQKQTETDGNKKELTKNGGEMVNFQV